MPSIGQGARRQLAFISTRALCSAEDWRVIMKLETVHVTFMLFIRILLAQGQEQRQEVNEDAMMLVELLNLKPLNEKSLKPLEVLSKTSSAKKRAAFYHIGKLLVIGFQNSN